MQKNAISKSVRSFEERLLALRLKNSKEKSYLLPEEKRAAASKKQEAVKG